jgi:nucleoside-diphosphate-sugar epimerase
MLERVCVTGSTGFLGRRVVAALVEAGHAVVGSDRVKPGAGCTTARRLEAFVHADLTDLEGARVALKGCDALVHLAAAPNPLRESEEEIVRNNLICTWNVLASAEMHGIERIVVASSINAIGATFSPSLEPRPWFPIDESQPSLCADGYAQSKWLGEQMAEAFSRRRPDAWIASLRFPQLWTRARQAEHRAAAPHVDPLCGAKGFWSWADIDEVARAFVLALEPGRLGHEAVFLSAPDTTSDLPTRELLRRVHPEAELRAPFPGHASAVSTEKARRLLGWIPRATWRRPPEASRCGDGTGDAG